MMKTQSFSQSVVVLAAGFFLGAGAVGGFAAEETGGSWDAPAALTAMANVSPEQAKALDEIWRDSPNRGLYVVSEHIAQMAAEYQNLLKSDGPEAVAQKLVENYSGPAANDHMAAAAIALRGEAGLTRGNSLPRGSKVNIAKKENPEAMIEPATAIFHAIGTSGAPQAKLAAVEFLLQLQSEGLVCLHNMAGNGAYFTPGIPHVITGLAGPFLQDPDPFVRALADWSISIAVCNENDREKGEAWPPQEGETPEWFTQYMAQDATLHLPYDYVRQVVSMGLHRGAADLMKLAADVSRRAKARADWLKHQGAEPAPFDAAIAKMDAALAGLQGVTNPQEFHNKYLEWRRTVRDVVLQGPDINFQEMVYIKRHSVRTHLQPGVHSASQFPDGGDIFVQSGFDPAAEIRSLDLTTKISKGFGHDLDLWWDGDKIVFAWKVKGVQKLFEIGLDGENLVQITDGPFDDVDPAYLPDGEVVFGSTRGEVGIMCNGGSGLGSIGGNGESGTFGGLHTNIFRTWDDRARVERLSYCKDDDAYPHVLNDGRIVWMRWDYQERGVNEIFSLWVMHPDGTGSDGFHKVHIPAKVTIQALRDTRPIEDSGLMVSAGGGHYNYNEGTIVLGDPREGINNPDSLKNVTPFASPVLFGWGGLEPVAEGGVPYLGGYYCKPWALSEKSFLVSATYDQPQSNNFQAYYIDVWGNKELLHRDKLYETVCVTPIKPRKRPMVLANKTNDDLAHATLYLDDMYADMPEVEKGSVKYLRIMQMIHWIKGLNEHGNKGIQFHPLANAAECFGFGTGGQVRTVGTVPINDDGSAFFEVPADADLYFQALDENFRAVQRMRTHVEFQPGEFRGCIGCHETKTDAVGGYRMGQSLAGMTPVRPTPPPWGDQEFIDYEKHIQPIFDAKCVECHAGKADQGWLDLTAKRDEHGFMQGYRAIYGLKADDSTPDVVWTVTGEVDKKKTKVPKSHDHPWWQTTFDGVLVRDDTTGGAVTEPYQFGAVTHPFATKLVEDPEHRKLLTPREMQTIMNWFDVQIPYFSTSRQKTGKNLIQVKIEPYAPFEKNRQHTIHHGVDVTPQL